MLTRMLLGTYNVNPIVYVGGNSASDAGSTSGSYNLSLTALTGGISSSAASGDIVVAGVSTSVGGPTISDGTTNYTQIAALNSGSGGSSTSILRVSYKVLTAADANTVFGPSGASNRSRSMVVHVWRGVNQTTPIDVTSTTATATGSTLANPPAITPVTQKAIIVAIGAGSSGSGGYTSAANMQNFIGAFFSSGNQSRVGANSAYWMSGAFDPNSFGGSTGSGTGGWCAVTLALRPA